MIYQRRWGFSQISIPLNFTDLNRRSQLRKFSVRQRVVYLFIYLFIYLLDKTLVSSIMNISLSGIGQKRVGTSYMGTYIVLT